jgi:hypothetical protein
VISPSVPGKAELVDPFVISPSLGDTSIITPSAPGKAGLVDTSVKSQPTAPGKGVGAVETPVIS